MADVRRDLLRGLVQSDRPPPIPGRAKVEVVRHLDVCCCHAPSATVGTVYLVVALRRLLLQRN